MSDDLDDFFQDNTRQTRADAQKNRDLILTAAKQLFAEQGVEAVSMTAIAVAAGVGKGTLYRHFESKMMLCIALLDADQRDLQARSFRRFAKPDSPRHKLHWFLSAVIAFVVEHEAMLNLPDAGSTYAAAHWRAHGWWRQTIIGLLRPLRPKGDLEMITDMIFLLIDVRAVGYLVRGRGYTQGRIVEGICRLIDGLLPETNPYNIFQGN
ncbi:MAG TPA: helix-turn-helix domain-containing protein [Aggregatilineales bacterium]|nr:TetR/AcrR family transcriptional regulator [Anaerolineales bacterium]HRE47388.1 helix-turn-helix domain-containing protein [Aggregatilineales bacterium]